MLDGNNKVKHISEMSDEERRKLVEESAKRMEESGVTKPVIPNVEEEKAERMKAIWGFAKSFIASMSAAAASGVADNILRLLSDPYLKTAKIPGKLWNAFGRFALSATVAAVVGRECKKDLDGENGYLLGDNEVDNG